MDSLRQQSRKIWLGLVCAFALAASGEFPVGGAEAPAADAAELKTAHEARSDRNYDYAIKLYSEFAAKHPESPQLPEAWLGIAESYYRQEKFDEALSFLRDKQAAAGASTDQFEYWIGEVLFAKGELDQAEAAFAGMMQRHPESGSVLAASVAQADTFFQRRNFERTAALLGDVNGAFARVRTNAPSSTPAVNGLLLLADSLFELRRFDEVEPVLNVLPSELPSRAAWRRVALLARVLSATGRAEQAEASLTNLLTRAEATGIAEILAESRALQGSVLEKVGKPAEALTAYETNLAPGLPLKWRTQALVRVVELAQTTGGPAAALSRLELLSAQKLDEPARDLVQLTTGELHLRLFGEVPAGEKANPALFSPVASNHIHGALRNFTNLIGGFTNSPYLAKAWFDRGWCHWELRQLPEAAASFDEAARRLPAGVDQAQALFKLADARFQLQQFGAALTNYSRVVREFGELPEIKGSWLDQAYFQMIQAAIRTGNQAEAEFAVNALLAQFPGNFHAERGLLMVAQFLNDIGQPARSRAVLENFTSRFPNSTLAPEIELAIARTYELDGKWPEAVDIYGRWLARFTNHVSRPTAEFSRAVALYRADDLSSSLSGFTNFVAHYPASELTPKALLQVGDHHFNQGEFQQAELYYQLLFSGSMATNWPVSRLTYQAQVLASRAAFERHEYVQAAPYLTNLLNKPVCATNSIGAPTNCCPADVRAEALFAYGDVLSLTTTLDVATRFSYARNAFSQLIAEFPDSSLVPAALGRKGECCVQLEAYEEAVSAFTECMKHLRATVTERSRAEIALGQALELQADKQGDEQASLLMEAGNHYLNVFYEKNVNREDGEVRDDQLVALACDLAAKLASRRRDFAAAAGLYERLQEKIPVLGDYYAQTIRELKERAGR